MSYYQEEDGGSLKAQLKWRKKCLSKLSKEEYGFVAQKSVFSHYFLGIRTFVFYFSTLYLLANYHKNPFIWIPAGFFQGQWLVNLIFLNHECIHQLVFNKRDSRLKIAIETWSGRIYCVLPMIGSTYFRAYHSMHHHQFFQGTDDPKSTHFVPKDNSRKTRIKYWGPGLGAIFNGIQASVSSKLSKDIQRTHFWEKLVNKSFHLGVILYFNWSFGFSFWMKVHAIPHFFWFPVAFMINRCGQHYCCNPKESALQSTNCIGNWFWDLCHLYSEYHVEHHTFAEVQKRFLNRFN